MKTISPLEFSQNSSKYILLDVREVDELEKAKITPCLHIPMHDLPQRLHQLNFDQEYVVLCHSGQRSARVVEYLTAIGYQAMNLEGGIKRYQQEIHDLS